MHTEDQNILTKEEKDLPILDLDDLEEIELNSEKVPEIGDIKVGKEKRHKVRKSIEDILEERALRRQLSDIFDDDILPD